MKATNFIALKAQQGNWEYYLCRISFMEAVQYLQFAEQVNPYEELDKLLQREISSRAGDIAAYLSNNNERFFGSLIVAVYGGAPKFSPIEIEGASFLGNKVGSIGILNFDGQERYYVLDGQHRLSAMKIVCAKDPKRYERDEISLILVSHPDDLDGIQRARRLFTNVNRYAIKTNKATNIALDEDDPVAILTRRIVRELPYFRAAIKISTRNRKGEFRLVAGEALQIGSDDAVLMTLPTLYECNRSLLFCDDIVTAPKQIRPDQEALENAWTLLVRRWTSLLNGIPSFHYNNDNKIFSRNRENGGDLTARPIGLKAICRAVGLGYAAGVTEEKIIAAVTKKIKLSESPWRGLLWNSEDGTMFAGKERMELASEVLLFWMGQGNKSKLQKDIRTVTSGAASLPA